MNRILFQEEYIDLNNYPEYPVHLVKLLLRLRVKFFL